jgi:hypothetical protein
VAQHAVPASDAAQSAGVVHSTVSSVGHVDSHSCVPASISAQHVCPPVHGVLGHLPAVVPLELPLDPPPLELPVPPPLDEPPEEPPPLLPPLVLPLLPPLVLPLLPPLVLPLLLPLTPPSPAVPPLGEELPHAIHTRAPATTAAQPNEKDADARDIMGILRGRANLRRLPPRPSVFDC